MTDQWLAEEGVREDQGDYKEQRHFGGDGYVHYLDCGDICKHLLNCIL
jgi:hypothetical protein